MNKKHTIKDIAKLSGVSKGTVDRVLHNRGKVSKKALISVKKVLDKIEYKPNLLARNLKTNKVYTICVLLPDPSKDAYWKQSMDGVEAASKKFNPLGVYIELLIFDLEKTTSFFEANNKVFDKKPDAVLLPSFFYRETLDVINEYHKLNIIVSIFNDRIVSEKVLNFVGQDLFKSGRLAAHLMHLTINVVKEFLIIHMDETFSNSTPMQLKEKGFRDYFNRLGKDNIKIDTLNTKKETAKKEIAAYFEAHPTTSGIFVSTSKAFEVVNILNKINAQKLKVIGYDLLKENIIHLKKGNIDFLIHQNPKQQALLGLTYLAEHFIFDKDVPKEKLLPIDIITSENVDSYLA